MYSYFSKSRFFILFLFVAVSCSYTEEYKGEDGGNSSIELDNIRGEEYSYHVYQLDSTDEKSGYGFDILLNGKLFIHQRNVPAPEGMHAFDSEKNAIAVAKLIIRKLEKNIIPPTASVRELDSLGIF